jgi:hypothetical protein
MVGLVLLIDASLCGFLGLLFFISAPDLDALQEIQPPADRLKGDRFAWTTSLFRDLLKMLRKWLGEPHPDREITLFMR